MGSQQCVSVASGIGLLAAVGISFVLVSRYWQISSEASSEPTYNGITSYAGLWVRCTSYTQGQFQCDHYDVSYLGLGVSLNTQRAFMVIAVILVYPGLICGVLGLPNVKAIDDEKAKLYTARTGGGLIMAAGILTLIAVSWYAGDVVQQFQEDSQNGNAFVYQFGVALYVGWICGGFAVISGLLLICCTPGPEIEEYRPSYHPPRKSYRDSREAEYV